MYTILYYYFCRCVLRSTKRIRSNGNFSTYCYWIWKVFFGTASNLFNNSVTYKRTHNLSGFYLHKMNTNLRIECWVSETWPVTPENPNTLFIVAAQRTQVLWNILAQKGKTILDLYCMYQNYFGILEEFYLSWVHPLCEYMTIPTNGLFESSFCDWKSICFPLNTIFHTNSYYNSSITQRKF